MCMQGGQGFSTQFSKSPFVTVECLLAIVELPKTPNQHMYSCSAQYTICTRLERSCYMYI